jgi:hypothetical protein
MEDDYISYYTASFGENAITTSAGGSQIRKFSYETLYIQRWKALSALTWLAGKSSCSN